MAEKDRRAERRGMETTKAADPEKEEIRKDEEGLAHASFEIDPEPYVE